MDTQQRLQIYANALKLFTDESPAAVKALATLDALPDKLAFGPDGYIVLAQRENPSAYTQVASLEGRPFYWEVSSQPGDGELTPMQQRALRRYGFKIPAGSDENPSQDWPRERADELPGWIERVFRDVFGLPEGYGVELVGGV